MTVTIELSPDEVRRLEQEAARSGQAPEEFLRAAMEEKLKAAACRETRIELAVRAGRIAWSGEKLAPRGPVAETRGPETVAQLVVDERR